MCIYIYIYVLRRVQGRPRARRAAGGGLWQSAAHRLPPRRLLAQCPRRLPERLREARLRAHRLRPRSALGIVELRVAQLEPRRGPEVLIYIYIYIYIYICSISI